MKQTEKNHITMDNNRIKLQFSSITNTAQKQYDYSEVTPANRNYIYYGSDNKYPLYLINLYENCSTLASIINGTVDFVMGDKISINDKNAEDTIVNSKNESLSSVIKKISLDLLIFGGFALQVVRNVNNEVIELIPLDFSRCRVDEELTKVFYSKNWGKTNAKAIEYPAYNTTSNTSVYYFQGQTRNTYPNPPYKSAILSCETQVDIKRFHKNTLTNNFGANGILNLNNGTPTDEEKKAFEKSLNANFMGPDSKKLLISFNESKESACDFVRIDDDNFDAKYIALNKSSIQDIFVSMRAIPVLFGLMTETTGFDSQEFNEAFTLYNKVTVSPIQKLITATLKMITNDVITIEPFVLKDENQNNNNNTI